MSAAGAGEGSSVGSSTAVLVMTDVEGSTRLWADDPTVMNAVMTRHHEIVHRAVTAHGGWRPVDQGEGDAVFAVFDSAVAAVAAVSRFQRELAVEVWPADVRIRVRVGVHAGEVTIREGNLFGSTVNRCARLRGLGAGGQVLLSAPVWELVRDRLPDGLTTVDLGEHRMKDLTRPEHVHQLVIDDLPGEFPPLASLDRAQHNLPIQTSSFLGREAEVRELVDLLTRERLVTIVGFGGMGKTRLALQVAAELATGDGDGVWFVDLSAVTDPDRIPSAIATLLGIPEGGDGPLAALLNGIGPRRLLLVLDNLEQVLDDAAAVVDQLITAGSSVRVLTTSREALRLRGEQVYRLSPLPLPPAHPEIWTDAELGRLSTYAAVSLFITRAAAARQDFALTAANAAAIAAICVRLDGVPLALELAAARTRALAPETLLPRLERALKVLTGGSRDLPSRHQTLRATITWSYDALDRGQQQLLNRISVFPGTFTLDAAEQICAPAVDSGDDDLDVIDVITDLVDRSLLRHHPGTDDQPEDRYSLLVSIREFAVEQLAAAGHTSILVNRHADYYTALTTLPPDWTPQDEELHSRVVALELNNLRAALAHIRAAGTPSAECQLALNLMFPVHLMGQDGEARTIGDSALARPGGRLSDRVRLLTNRSTIESNARQFAKARFFSARAVEEARALGDRAAVVAALSVNVMFAASKSEFHRLIGEVDSLLLTVPQSGGVYPGWLLVQNRDEAVAANVFAEKVTAEAAQRRVLAAASGDTILFQEVNLAVLLFNQGRFAEALELVARYERRDEVSSPVPTRTWFRALFMAIGLRCVGGQFDMARVDLELAEELVRGLDMREDAVLVEVHRAAVDRALGDRSAAAGRLRRVLDGPTAVAPNGRAYAAWLSAVMAREDGHVDEAGRLLADAWALASAEARDETDLVLQCLLEHAVQVTAAEPAEAARLIGLVIAHRNGEVFYHGVVYEPESMLADLRGRLGDDKVERILAGIVAQPLPDSPDWGYL